jgi:hypothetical protein
MAERWARIEMRRKTEGERVAHAKPVRGRHLRRKIASVRAASRANAHLLSNRRHIAENRLLLFPVMILLRSWFVWRFRAITGEIFFVRNASPPAGNTVSRENLPSRLHTPLKSEARSERFSGPNSGKSAGRKSPARRDQAIEFIRDFGAKNFRDRGRAASGSGDTPRNTESVSLPPRVGEIFSSPVYGGRVARARPRVTKGGRVASPHPPAEFILRPRFARTGEPGTSPVSGFAKASPDWASRPAKPWRSRT